MRKLLFTMGIVVLGAHDLQAADWKLVWSDEFNYEGAPDPAKWDYEEGFVRNNEIQYYTRERLENARVEGGNLVIECRKEHYLPYNHSPVDYTSASLITLNNASWQYGRIEVRAKVPSGKGVWPAIWTLGADQADVPWPACGEIDIMEYLGREPAVVHANAHFAVDGKHKDDAGILQTNAPSADFHVYAVEWNSKQIDYYFDTNKYHTVLLDQATDKDGHNAFRAPHYLIINFAYGGDWGGPVDDSVLPQKFLVDYVRVYQAADSSTTNASAAK